MVCLCQCSFGFLFFISILPFKVWRRAATHTHEQPTYLSRPHQTSTAAYCSFELNKCKNLSIHTSTIQHTPANVQKSCENGCCTSAHPGGTEATQPRHGLHNWKAIKTRKACEWVGIEISGRLGWHRWGSKAPRRVVEWMESQQVSPPSLSYS